LNEARIRAQAQVKQARADIEQYKQQAMSKLQSDAAQLATDIVRAVLRPWRRPAPVVANEENETGAQSQNGL